MKKFIFFFVAALISTFVSAGERKLVQVAYDEVENGGKYFITASYNGEEYFLPAVGFATGASVADTFKIEVADTTKMWQMTQVEGGWEIRPCTDASMGLLFTSNNNGVKCAKPTKAAPLDTFIIALGASAEYSYVYVSGTKTQYLSLYGTGEQPTNWRCYSSVTSANTMPNIVFYGFQKEGTVAKPVFSPSNGQFLESDGLEVSLTAEVGADIYYALNETVTDGNKTLYTEPIKLTQTTTIYAYAIKESIASKVADKTYTMIPCFASLDDLADDGKPTAEGTLVSVTFNEDTILESASAGYGAMLFKFSAGTGEKHDLYLYGYAAEGWGQKGGTISGSIIGTWKYYSSKWELCPDITLDKSSLVYTAPTGTGLLELMQQTQTSKMMVNGQLLIRQKDQLINAQGNKVGR